MTGQVQKGSEEEDKKGQNCAGGGRNPTGACGLQTEMKDGKVMMEMYEGGRGSQ